jgi:sodium-dependent phosphate cotransporter
MAGCTAGSLLGDSTNPIAALMIGTLATVLIQSSSTTTSIIVSLVGSDIITTEQAIYMVMGANIGTTVTNTLVALGQMGDADMLERAFAGATVHDCFNILSVIILLPIEAASGYLRRLTGAMVNEDAVSDGGK